MAGPPHRLDEPRPRQRRATLARLYLLVRPELPSLISSGLLLGVYSSCTMAIAGRLGKLVDVAAQRSPKELVAASWGLSALFLASGCANFSRLWLASRAAEQVIRSLRCAAFERLLRQPCEYFDDERHRTADLCQRLMGDCERVGRGLTDVAANGMKSIAQATGALAMMTMISPQLTSMLVVLVPATGISTVCYGRVFARPLERRRAAELSNAGVAADEVLGAIRVVHAFVREEAALRRYMSHADLVRDAGTRASTANASLTALLQTSGYFVILALLGYGGKLVTRGRMTVGSLTSMLLYSGYCLLGIMGCAGLATELHQLQATAERLLEVTDLPLLPQEERAAAGGAAGLVETHVLPEDAVSGELRVDGVVFAYPSRRGAMVWGSRDGAGVSFSMRAGRISALVGPSGAGKSTFCQLLLRMYRPLHGRILLDGVDLESIPTAYLRRLIAYVPQEPQLFAATIADNILYGLPPDYDASEEERRGLMEQAARAANAAEFIGDRAVCPNGYDTWVGERGRGLSGGQKQRVAIARALIKMLCGCARQLVFDEAASALDAASQRVFVETISGVLGSAALGGRTVVVITHDLGLMRRCDHIVLLKDGVVAAAGPFDKVEGQLDALRRTPRTVENGDAVYIGSPTRP